MRYTIQAFTDNTKTELIGDWSTSAKNISIQTGERGYDRASMFVPMGLDDAFNFYQYKALPYLTVNYDTARWKGRIEDRAIANGGIKLSAYGHWRALHDTLYTALWSDTSTRRWEELAIYPFAPEKHEMDTNNRLYVAPRANEGLDNTEPGGLAYRIPDKSTRDIVEVTYTYNFLAPNSTWKFRLTRRDKDFGYIAIETTVVGTGSLITATVTTTLSAASPAIGFTLLYDSATVTTLSNTGDVYFEITDIRVKTKTGTIYADDIIEDMVSAIPTTQLSHSMALVQSPAVDLYDVRFEDKRPADILKKLEYMGDNNTPPRVWTSAVFGGQLLQFHPIGEDSGRHWYIDIPAIDLQKTIDALSTSVYSTYQDENGRTLRTDTETNTASVTKNGIDRTFKATAKTTILAQAELIRDAELDERGDTRPRSSIKAEKVYNASGGLVPLIEPQKGDYVTIRNFPNVGSGLDGIQTFVIARTDFKLSDGTLYIVPSRDLPSVASLLATALKEN